MNTNKEIITTYEFVKKGDTLKEKGVYSDAITTYMKAYGSGTPAEIKYIVPRIAACFRKIKQPRMALNFYRGAKSTYGNIVNDHVMLTVLSSIHGDLENWEQALYCADCACALNDGEINPYLENVYRRIDANIGKKELS